MSIDYLTRDQDAMSDAVAAMRALFNATAMDSLVLYYHRRPWVPVKINGTDRSEPNTPSYNITMLSSDFGTGFYASLSVELKQSRYFLSTNWKLCR